MEKITDEYKKRTTKEQIKRTHYEIMNEKINMYFEKIIKGIIKDIGDDITKNFQDKTLNIDLNNLNITNILNNYENLIKKKIINPSDKLPDYEVKKYITEKSKKEGDEGKYNEDICTNNNEKYILFDKKIINGIEVGDIYNIKSNLIYHNKKIKI